MPGRLQLVSSETLAIHLSLPFLLVCALAYAADALRRLGEERTLRERLAIEAERKRIAWDLHDSAKQRIHAAHLLVSSLDGRVERAGRADRRPRDRRAGVRIGGHGHEPGRAALAARGPPARGGTARAGRGARQRRRSAGDRPWARARAAAAGRGARLPDRLRGADQRAATRRRHRDRHRPGRRRGPPAAERQRRRPRPAARSVAPAPAGCSRWRAAPRRSERA